MGYSLVSITLPQKQLNLNSHDETRYNNAAQYWTYTSSSGSFTSPAMKPGTYTMVYYQGEYPVATSSVTVTAGSTTSKSISGSVKTGTTIFKIGTWDGQYDLLPSHASPPQFPPN
jgi:hypothetical protein